MIILCKVLSSGDIPHRPSGGRCSGQFGRTGPTAAFPPKPRDRNPSVTPEKKKPRGNVRSHPGEH